MSSLNFMELCRLCLVKDRVQIPIFEGEGDIRQIFLKIAACLPVKVKKDDKLPKKICDDCMYKLEMLYQFWNTTANAEKQLLEWLGEAAEDKKTSSEAHVKQESLEQDPCSELAKSLSRVEAVLAEAREAESDNDNFASGKAETDSDDEPLSSLEPTTFVNVGLDGSGTNESHTQGEFLAPGAPSTSKTTNSTNAQTATSGSLLIGNGTKKLLRERVARRNHNKGPLPTKENILQKKRKGAIKIKQVCEICGEKFTLQNKFVAHCSSKHGIDKAFKCNLCSARMRSSSHLKRHMRMHDEVPRYTCQECNLGFNQKSNLELHIRRKHSKEIVVKCNICNKGFFCKAALEDHKNTHTGQRPFKCHLCDKTYMNKAHLALHKRWTHPELFGADRYHKCQICSKTFPYKKRLIKHLESHAGVRKYLCDLCGKAISTLSSLRHHRRTHTGEKPEVCNVCGRAFSTSKYLREHFRTHTGEKPYTCSFCGRGFTQRGSLSLHEKSHTADSYLCKSDDVESVMQSRQKSTEILQEMGFSVDTIVFPCLVCTKSFPSKALLTSHLNCHLSNNKKS